MRKDGRHPDEGFVSGQPEPARAPGKATAVQRRYEGVEQPQEAPSPKPKLVQAKGELASTENIHEFAGMGLRGPTTALPHREAIQRSFGRHDVSHIEAHIGGDAATAADAMGADAYATGRSVAFKSSPDLHTAAHEAAHVVQQRAGVSLLGGVGQAGDAHEQHADAVADAVVRGESAAPLLDRVTGSGGAGPSVQLKKSRARPKSAEVEIGGTTHRIVPASKATDGALTVDDSTFAALARGRLPAKIDVSGGALSGDLLTTAPANSTIRCGRTIWSRTADGWQDLKVSQKKGRVRGFAKYGGESVQAALVRLTEEGKLSISPTQIALLNAISQVETSGRIGCAQTYDNQVMSVGFKQVTLGHGSLEKIMRQAPAGFAKHGLVLDGSQKYPQRKGWSKAPSQIVGCPDSEELRQPEWALKFYHASMEPDVISALVDLALSELGSKVERTTKKHAAKNDLFNDPTAKAWLLQTYNNRKSFMRKAVALAVSRGAGATRERGKFLDILAQAIIDTYITNEPLIWYGKAKKGKKLTPEQDAALLARMKAHYEPIGKKKGTNITTKISRNLPVPKLRGGAGSGTPKDTPAPTAPATPVTPAVTPAAPAVTPAAPAADTTPVTDGSSATTTTSEPAQADSPASHEVTGDLPEYVCWAEPLPVTITASKLRVRSAPDTSTSDNIIGRFKRGDRVEVWGREGDWLLVQFEGGHAYVHGGYVEPAEPPKPSSASNTAPASEPTTAADSSPETTAGAGSSAKESGKGTSADAAAEIFAQVSKWLRTLLALLGEDRDEDRKPRGERSGANETPRNERASPKAPASTPTTSKNTEPNATGGGTFTTKFFKETFTVVDDNALLRNESRKSLGKTIPAGTRVYVLDAERTYVKIATAPGAAEVINESDNLWTAFSNLGGTGADVALGNEKTDDTDKEKADQIRGGLPEGRNPGSSPFKWKFSGYFQPSLGGKDLSSSLMSKVHRLMEWAIANDMVTDNIVIGDGVRNPKRAHKICVAWEIQHGRRVSFDAVKALPNGKDRDGNLWYQEGWSWKEVQAHAYKVRPSKKIAAAGYEPGDPKRAPLPVSGKRPGVSRHCTGRAVDVTIPWRAKGVHASKNRTDVWAWEEIYQQFGLHRPLHKSKMSNPKLQENWHIQETGKKLDGHDETP